MEWPRMPTSGLVSPSNPLPRDLSCRTQRTSKASKYGSSGSILLLFFPLWLSWGRVEIAPLLAISLNSLSINLQVFTGIESRDRAEDCKLLNMTWIDIHNNHHGKSQQRRFSGLLVYCDDGCVFPFRAHSWSLRWTSTGRQRQWLIYSLSRILYCQFLREFICPLFIKGPIRFNGDKSTPTHCLPRTIAKDSLVGGFHCPWTRAARY